jgi:SH3-like domain-containing protein
MIEKVIRKPQFLTIFIAIFLLASCQRVRRDPVIGVGYVSSNAINLRDRLGATQYTVATLKQGERVEILGRQHHWLHVRTAAQVEGWIEERHTVTQEIFGRFEKLRQTTAALPSQGTAHARREVNLHLEADYKSAVYYALKGDESCEVVGRTVAERAPRPKQDPGTKEYVDYFLVRNATAAGWGLAGNLDMAVPEEVLQYAEGKRVVAWFVLDPGEGQDPKPTILWATTSAMGLPYDFESVRVFSWGTRRKHYETSYIDSNLRGYYPIQAQKDPPGFTFTAESKTGERVEYKFLLQGTRVRRVSAPQPLSHSKGSLEHGGHGKKHKKKATADERR